MHLHDRRAAFTLIELLVVIAIIAILAVVVVLTLNPAQLLAQSRDANRVSDMATLQSALNLYVTDQAGASTFSLGNASDTYPSLYDPAATSTLGDQCQGLSMLSLNTSTGQSWQCSASSSYRNIGGTGWIPVNLNSISAGSPVSNLPVDPVNATSSGLFYAYNTNGSQFQVTADLESTKYKAQYGTNPNTTLFPEVISGGTQGISALYNPTGLVGYWPLNEGNGSTTIDQSGNGNTGTWSGTPIGSNGTYYTGGKVGAYAGDFNGTNDYVDAGAGSNLNVTSFFSLSAWVNPSNVTSIGELIAKSGGAATTTQYELRLNSGQIQFLSSNSGGGGYYCQIETSTVAANQWSYLTATFDGTDLWLYLNGMKIGGPVACNSGGTINVYSGDPLIGKRASGYYFAGAIDDARIYNRALSPAEVQALYSAEK